MNARRQIGFTLIELLVVIAIIALLASLLLPALNTAKARSRTAQCTGQLHHIGMAAYLAADDNDGIIPVSSGNSGCWVVTWDNWLRTYLGDNGPGYGYRNLKVLHCPQEALKTPWQWRGDGCICSSSGGYPRSYGILSSSANNNWDGVDLRTNKFGSVPDPSGTMYVADNGAAYNQGCYGSSPIRFEGELSDRHLGFANILFLDSHVAALKKSQTVGTGSLPGTLRGVWTMTAGD